MKKILVVVFTLFLVLVGFGIWFYQNTKPVSTVPSYKNFLITKGSGASKIGTDLEKSGFIKSSFAFRVYIQISGLSKKSLAGEYSLSPSFSVFKIVDQFLHGPAEIWVTIPEGLRVEEIAVKYASVLGKDADFVSDFVASGKAKEGYLFPDTYLFPKEVTAKQIIDKMLLTFDKKVGLDITKQDVVLASLVERETKTAEERPIVAGILFNRIEIGMPLQVDATIQYIMGKKDKWWGTVLLDDRKLKSSFNTYTNRGLPPSPICNPGLSSIKAVLNPAETDFLYYLHDTKGIIHYAKTLEEHSANIGKYIGG
jgi:UPF0755 protein